MKPYHEAPGLTLWHGDCIEVMAAMPDASIDAIVTDPPYDLTNRVPDVEACEDCGRILGGSDGKPGACPRCGGTLSRQRSVQGRGFMGKSWDGTGVAFNVATWEEALRVLKPGGHLLAFGGTRTHHRLMVAIEDAGFEIRDVIMWLYGSGFPKSLDVSKALDDAAGVVRPVIGRRTGAQAESTGQYGGWGNDNGEGASEFDVTAPVTGLAIRYEGWGTGLKPAYEPVVVARRPLAGTVAANVATYGTGALNIDAARIPSTDDQLQAKYASIRNAGPRENNIYGQDGRTRAEGRVEPSEHGRWPANIVLDEAAAQMLDAEVGPARSAGLYPSQRGAGTNIVYGAGMGDVQGRLYDDGGGPSRYFYTAKASRSEREGGLDGHEAPPLGTSVDRDPATAGASNPRAGSGRLSERDSMAAWANEVLEATRRADMGALLRKVTDGFGMTDGSKWSTALSGKPSEIQSLMDSLSTTSTETSSTTESPTSNSLTLRPTSAFIRAALSVMESGSSPAEFAAILLRLTGNIGISPLPDRLAMDDAVGAISKQLCELSRNGGLPVAVNVRKNIHPT